MKPETGSRRILILLALMNLLVLQGKTQSDLVYYQSNDLFNSSVFNPAFLTFQKEFTFSIFPLAGMGAGTNNLPVSNEIMSRFLEQSQTAEDYRGVFNRLMNQKLFLLNFNTNLLDLGYRSNFGHLNFRASDNLLLMTGYKGDLTDFLINPEFKNLVIDHSQLIAAEVLHYREYSLGFAKDLIRKKLSVGLRAKIYFGKSISFSEVSGKITERTDTAFLQIAGPLRVSFPANPQFEGGILKDMNMVSGFDLGSYLANAQNIGLGLDLGLTFKITPEIELSASAIDLGRIKWKNNINTLMFDDQFPIHKENIGPKLDENGIPMFDKNGVPILVKLNDNPMTDSISFKLTMNKSAFSIPIPASFYAGLHYQINPTLSMGMVDRYTKAGNLSYNCISLTANYDVNKKLTISSGYSLLGGSFSNIPLAILYKWETGQTYLGSDNILSFLFRSGSVYTGLSFGTCFYLFREKVRFNKPIDYLPFFKELKRKKLNKQGLIFKNESKS